MNAENVDQMRQKVKHIWERVEISLEAKKHYDDPYNEVEVSVILEGPHFRKRCWGFWDGGNTFRVRILAPSTGNWHWTSECNHPEDQGLHGVQGSFKAIDWTEEEKEENPTRRGFIKSTQNGHALEYADGTPFFLLGDTWWAVPTWRFIWYDDDDPRPLDETMGFKDMVQYRKKQKFNSANIMACFPNWRDDGHGCRVTLKDEKRTVVRSGWNDPITGHILDMHNEHGYPFDFPGKIPGYPDVYPDVTSLNPAYFQVLDKKLDYLNDQGFTPSLEILRRDCLEAWRNYYPWPQSYLRYMHHIFARYQAHHLILCPIHYDFARDAIHARYINDIMKEYKAKYGELPFGTLLSANSPSSSLAAFGDDHEAPWISLHQIGNVREHEFYWLLTEIYHAEPPKPALNGEPYYSAWGVNVNYYEPRGMPNSPEDDRCVRNGMYGSFLSGGLAGYVYGTSGIVRGEREEGYKVRMWEGIQFTSANMISHFREFVFSEGKRYQDLIPMADMVSPNKDHHLYDFEGWAFCARTKERDLVMAYFEKGNQPVRIRSVLSDGVYQAAWFNPRTGEWIDQGEWMADFEERISPIPQKPTDDDWGLKLKLIRRNTRDNSVAGINPSTKFGDLGIADLIAKANEEI